MKLIKNYLYNVGYQVFVLIIPLITVPYISRVLGSTGVGINAFTNSIISYFVLFGSIGVNLYGNRQIAYVRDDKKLLSQTFWEISLLRIIVISITYVIFLIFLFFVQEYQSYYFYQSILILSAGLDISWFFMGMEDFKKTVLRNIVLKVLSLIVIFIFIKSQNDLGLYILVINTSALLSNLVLWPYLKIYINKPCLKKLNIIKHLIPSLTLFLPQIATQVYLVLNKTMLGYMTNVQNSGYYENTDKLIKIVLAIVTATGTVMLPRMANIFSFGNYQLINKSIRQSFDFVSFISIPMAFGLASVADKFSIWFFGKEFAITGQLIPILSIVIILIGWSNVLGMQYLLPTNQTKYFTISVTVGALVNLFLNVFFIKLFGIFGAIWATVISECTVTLVQLYYVKNNVNISRLFIGVWKYALSAGIMFIAVRSLNNWMTGSLICFIIQGMVGAIIYVVLVIILRAPIILQFFQVKEKFINRK